MSRAVVVEFIGHDRNLSSSIDGVENKSGKLTATLSKVGKVGAVALAAGAAIGAKALWDAGQKASDLNETMSKTNQIFGDKQGNALATWAGEAATKIGMSKQVALDAASTFGVFGKAAGKSGEDLSGFAKQNTQLAADLASFNNTTPEEAIEAMGAAFRGEMEPIRKYGVLLDDASMRQQALKMGLVKTTTEALTPQQKVLAAQALIMKQTSDAQGDFSRTSGGLANQQRILKAQLENVQTSIGQKVLPVLLKLATFANNTLIPAIETFGGWLGDKLPPIFERISEVVSKVFGGMSGDVAGPMQDVKDIIKSTVSIVTSLWHRFGGIITDYTKKALANAITIIKAAFKIVSGIFKLVAALLKGDWKGAWDAVKQILRGAVDLIIGILRQFDNVVKTVMRLLWSAVKAIVKAGWEAIKSVVKAGADGIVDYVRSIPDRLRAAAGLFGQAGKWLISAFVDGMKNAAGIISGIAGNVWTTVKGLLNSAIGQINSALEFTVNLPGPDVHIDPPNIPMLAKGTRNFIGGLAIVGEQGPELVRMPRGSQVFTNRQSRGMLAGSSGGGSDRPIIVQLMLDGRMVEQVLIRRTEATGRPLQVRTI